MPRKACTPLGAQLQLLNKAVALTKRAIKAQTKQRKAAERLHGVQSKIADTGVQVKRREEDGETGLGGLKMVEPSGGSADSGLASGSSSSVAAGMSNASGASLAQSHKPPAGKEVEGDLTLLDAAASSQMSDLLENSEMEDDENSADEDILAAALHSAAEIAGQ